MINNLAKGYIMAGIGFIMILANALDYIFHWDYFNQSFSVIGIVFLLIGLKIAKTKNS